MENQFNWGILGCGRIARTFCEDLQFLPDAKVYALASTSAERAKNFKQDFNAAEAYNNYEALANDPNVDAIYIATPHSFHKEHTLLCLEHKKPVLCEKPFALDLRQTLEMHEAAKANNTFVMDAFWVRFLPAYLKAKEILDSGELGALKMMRSDFGFNAPFDPEGRLYNKKLGGGALMDIGVYPVFAALFFMGIPADISTLASFGKTNVDEQIGMLFKYNDGRMANLYASIEVESPIDVDLYFEKGWLRIQRSERIFRDLIYCKTGEEQKLIKFDINGYGFTCQAEEVMRCVRLGLIESPMMTHEFTACFLEVIDRIKVDAGISYKPIFRLNRSNTKADSENKVGSDKKIRLR